MIVESLKKCFSNVLFFFFKIKTVHFMILTYKVPLERNFIHDLIERSKNYDIYIVNFEGSI